jgi:UDP-N-acetylglucosamine--N-acetylmuramyl-(pentapeptide) pyrophosphoryl-undecaprenol N-acetylglucosamine transferase
MTKDKKLKVVIAGGGTGGHVTPAIAVGDALRKQGCEVVFIGSHNGPEREMVAAAKFPFHPIQSGKLRRYAALANITDAFRVALGFFQARNLLARIKPDVVFAKGGFVSVPVVYAAAFLEIPIVVHESDVVMGLANRLAIDKASVVCTGFPIDSYPSELRKKLRFTGNPIRQIFYDKQPTRAEIANKFGLTAARPVVMFIGSSQGAHDINQMVFDQLPVLLEHLQIIHITGVDDLEAAQELKKSLPIKQSKRYLPYGFVKNELPLLMGVSDLVVSRASANVLTELATLRKAVVLIPLPSAASDHQRANATVYQKRGAAIVIEQDDITSSQLAARVIGMLEDKEQLAHLRRSIGFFQSPQAADLIAEIVRSVV